MQLSIGPIQYYWPKQQIESFYADLASTDVSLIYLGETVCSKRNELSADDWLGLAKELAQSGKQVVLSSLALIEAPQELALAKPYFESGEFWIEANDLGMVQLARQHQLPFVAGAALNCYNLSAIKRLLAAGMKRWVMPVELSSDWLNALLQEAHAQALRDQFEVEVYGYGHLPLAYSARCFTARSENKPKDQCKKCCIHYPEGRAVDNLEGQRLFVLNDIQTMSGACLNLVNDMQSMTPSVDWFRISPQANGRIDLIQQLQTQLVTPKKVKLASREWNGYWDQIAGLSQV